MSLFAAASTAAASLALICGCSVMNGSGSWNGGPVATAAVLDGGSVGMGRGAPNAAGEAPGPRNAAPLLASS